MEQSKSEIKRNITLTHFILSEQHRFPGATGELSILLHSIEIACKYISAKVRAAGLFNLYGMEGSTNVQGEDVKKLDVVANEAFSTSISRSSTVCLYVSEENQMPTIVPDSKGHYLVAFDPLDGSSNIDANVSIGTIFAVYRKDEKDQVDVKQILKSGTHLVAAGYCMYGSATVMVLSTGNGVNGFTLDPSSGEFVLTHPKIQIPEKKNIYSINEGYSKHWFDSISGYINKIKSEDYSARYVGSMVADVHRTLLYGGIFLYPADKRSSGGKLRLLYEANPMAFILEQAGGTATNGSQRILDIQPTDPHQRTAVFLGSKRNMEELEQFLNKP